MNAPKSRIIRMDWLIYILAASGLIGLITWSMAKEIDQNPARDAIVDLGSHEMVTIRLTTDPFPALPTGTVVLNFMPMDSGQRPVTLDGITYEYGMTGNDQPIGSGAAQLMEENGLYMFTGNVQFQSAGNWWIRAKITKGSTQANANFTITVKSAQ